MEGSMVLAEVGSRALAEVVVWFLRWVVWFLLRWVVRLGAWLWVLRVIRRLVISWLRVSWFTSRLMLGWRWWGSIGIVRLRFRIRLRVWLGSRLGVLLRIGLRVLLGVRLVYWLMVLG